MALHLDPSGSDPIREQGHVRIGDLGAEHRLVRDGIEQLAHGALVCPECALPVAIDQPIAISTRLRCGYCGTRAPARGFLVEDVFDTLANEVCLVARIDR